MYYIRGAAKVALFIAALKFVEAVIAPPIDTEPRWMAAAVLTFNLWAAGAALSAIAGVGWVLHRLFGWPAGPAAIATDPYPARHPGRGHAAPDMGVQRRRRLVLLRRPGGDRDGGHQVRPVAGLAVSLFGGNSLIWLEIFVLGLLAMAAPLVLLAWLPLKAGSSLLERVRLDMNRGIPARS